VSQDEMIADLVNRRWSDNNLRAENARLNGELGKARQQKQNVQDNLGARITELEAELATATAGWEAVSDRRLADAQIGREIQIQASRDVEAAQTELAEARNAYQRIAEAAAVRHRKASEREAELATLRAKLPGLCEHFFETGWQAHITHVNKGIPAPLTVTRAWASLQALLGQDAPKQPGPCAILEDEWADRVTRFSIDPHVASAEDIAQMATELSDLRAYLTKLVRTIDNLSDDDSKTNWDFYSGVMELMQRTKQLYRFVNGGNVLDGQTHTEGAEG